MHHVIHNVISKIETIIYTQSLDSEKRLRIEDLANEAGMSRFQLQRLFKRETGTNLSDFILQLKLYTASNFVCLTNGRLIDIAINMGYNGQQSFTRAFSKERGISPSKLRRTMKQNYAAFSKMPEAQAIPVRIERSLTARRLWMRRYIGSYMQVLDHWADFAERLSRDGLIGQGPFYGVIFDDPEITPEHQIRYGCAIEAPRPSKDLPQGWIEFIGQPSRFVVFALRCRYMEGHARLRPRVLSWFQNNREMFGTAGAFEVYATLPSGGEHHARDVELHVSLAN